MNKRKLIIKLLIATENMVWVLDNNPDIEQGIRFVLIVKGQTYLDMAKALLEGSL